MSKLILDNYISPHWPAPHNVNAFTTTRKGGVSKPPFASFNLGTRGNDDDAAVNANRAKLAADLALPNSPVWLKQVHGIRAVPADTITEAVEADASYTHKSGTVCVVLTADCLPILLCNRDGTQAAAIHAGWRGLLAGVIEQTISQMQVNPLDVLVWLGPAIGPEKFEVDAPVYDPFVNADPQAKLAFKPTRPGKWLANIYVLARQRLSKVGVHEDQIYGGDYCTYSNSELFYSYRRDQGVTGSMASLIWLS